MVNGNKKVEVKVEPKVVTKLIKRVAAVDREQIASRQRAHEVKVQTFLLGR